MNNAPPLWKYFGASVRGASHIRSNLPNQDAILWFPDEQQPGQASRLIMAVSDGHGSRKNFRSDQGSRMAVKTAIHVLRQELFSEGDLQKPLIAEQASDSRKTLLDLAKNNLSRKLVHEWSTAVQNHWQQNPLQPKEQQEWQDVIAEWQQAQDKESPDPQKKSVEPFAIPYGATLLIVLVTETFILYLQLGDGDILCVDSNGKATCPLTRDSRLIANETTSLCTPNAWQDFRIALQIREPDMPDTFPVLILLSTDGYANSFSSEADFQRIGPDYRDMIGQSGLKKVGQALAGYLNEASQQGSGDDITLGLIKRLEEDDRDYLPMWKEQLEERSQQKIQQLEKYQKKTSRNITVLKRWLIGTSGVALLSLGLCSWLFYRVSALEQSLQKTQQSQPGQPRQPPPAAQATSSSHQEPTAQGATSNPPASASDHP